MRTGDAASKASAMAAKARSFSAVCNRARARVAKRACRAIVVICSRNVTP